MNVNDTFFDLSKRIEGDFPEIDSDICTDFYHTDSEYADLRKQVAQLKKTHPIIDKVLEGEGAISLLAEEHNALVQCMAIIKQVEDMERQQIYFRGHTDCYAYLKKIKAL